MRQFRNRAGASGKSPVESSTIAVFSAVSLTPLAASRSRPAEPGSLLWSQAHGSRHDPRPAGAQPYLDVLSTRRPAMAPTPSDDPGT